MIIPDQEDGADMAESSEFSLVISEKPVQYFNQDNDPIRFRFIPSVYMFNPM